MKEIAPLIQTVLWVGLISGIVWRYHKQIHSLIEAIQKRIESVGNLGTSLTNYTNVIFSRKRGLES